METRYSVLINLKNCANANAFERKNRIHVVEFERVEKWIDQRLEKIGDQLSNKTESKPERFQEAISVLGSRGSGKTSFLMSLCKACSEGKKASQIQVLDIIDPTLIEEKGHIFLTIISQIRVLVEEELKNSECDPESEAYSWKKIWEKRLSSLSHGLPSIDGIGKPSEESWQDPEYIMNKGLRAVQSAKELEKNFHQFVEISLQILKKKLFLLPLDDIDVNFIKGWPVLETLRKYLATPLIMTVISGDMELFSKAIRKQHWRNFGRPLLINEAERQKKIEEYNSLVTEMEGQYLQKVLRPERRVYLNTLLEKIDSYGIEITVTEDREEELQGVQEYYADKLKAFGIVNPSQSKAFYSYLLGLPLRTQVQFLSLFAGTKEENMNNQPMDITGPFLSNLYEKQVDIDLAKNNPHLFNVVILKLLMREKDISESYQLQPITTDLSRNSSLLALSLLFAQKVQTNPYLIFDYFIRIGYMRNLCDTFNYYENITPSLKDISPSVEGLCQHAGLYQDKVLRDAVANISAYLRGFLNWKSEARANHSSWAGTIPLKGLYAFSKKDKEHRIDGVFGYQFSHQTSLAYMPLSISEYPMRNASVVTYSVFTLLGAICDLIKEKENLEEALVNFSQVRSYLMPDFRDTQNISDSSTEILEPQQESDSSNLKNNIGMLEEATLDWIEKYPGKGISPYLLGKIATRFFYAIENIEKQRFSNLGDKVYAQIRSLMNAVVIEDIRENRITGRQRQKDAGYISDINLNNTLESDNILLQNLEKGFEIEGDFSFSKWVLSCPVLLAYLPLTLVRDIKKYLHTIDSEAISGINIFQRMRQVELASKNQQEEQHSKTVSEETIFSAAKSKKGVETMIVLQKKVGIEFETFMSMTSEQLMEGIFPYFQSNVTEDTITTLRKNIKSVQNKRDNVHFTRAVRAWKDGKTIPEK